MWGERKMFWRKKKKKNYSKPCGKCGDLIKFDREHFGVYSARFSSLCGPCDEIWVHSMARTETEEEKARYFLFHRAIEEKGVGWYKKHRDILAPKMMKERLAREAKQKRERQRKILKMVKRIEAWK